MDIFSADVEAAKAKSTKYVAMYPVPTHSATPAVMAPPKLKEEEGLSVPDAAKLGSAGSQAKKAGSQSIYTTPYPGIQSILQPPNEFTLVAGRMSSGSK